MQNSWCSHRRLFTQCTWSNRFFRSFWSQHESVLLLKLLATGYHVPKRPSQQETVTLDSDSSQLSPHANLLTRELAAHLRQERGCPVIPQCGQPYPHRCQIWFFNYHVVCRKALCQFNYCLINGVLRVYFRGLAIYSLAYWGLYSTVLS